jgi:lipoprotein NlpD
MMKSLLAGALVVLLLGACTSRTSAPVIDRMPPQGGAPTGTTKPAAPPSTASTPSADFYTVKRGDTLYGIALDHGQDYRDIATWNNIANVNIINVGQVLRVTPPGTTSEGGVVVRPITPSGGAPTTAGTPAATGIRTEPSGARRPYSDEALAQAQREARGAPVGTAVAKPEPPRPETPKPEAPKPAAPASDSEDVAWAWPAAGRVIGQFTEGGANKGIDISAKVGDPVTAAGAGRVVYAGQGLRGYGRLIIIKHNTQFLSAYAHNSTLLVKEGQNVTRGQKIAEAGSTDSDVPKLHFEIRRQGKPVDPTAYLPPR